MAASSFSSDITSCGVCFEPYSSSKPEHIPHSLSCAHTFCFLCCSQLIERKAIVCPTCRKSSKANSASDLPRNLTMIAFLDADSQLSSSSSLAAELPTLPPLPLAKDEKCVNHMDGCSRKAKVYCASCNGCFCQPCADTIHQSSFMKTHRLGSLSERQVRCPLHDDMICDLVVAGTKHILCMKCHQYGKFRNKRVRPIEEVSAEVVGELKKQWCSVSSMSDALKSQQSKLKKDIQSVRDNAAACHKQVDIACQQMEEVIAARKRYLHQKIEVFEQSTIQSTKEQLQINLETANSLIDLEKRMKVLASGDSDKVRLVSSFADLEAELKAQEVSAEQLLNQPDVIVMSLRQDIDALRKQLCTFASLTTTLEASSPEEIAAKKLADEGTIDLITDKFTPLADAASENKLCLVKALIKFGADFNAKSMDDATPLMTASLRGYVEVVKLLLAVEGIDVNCRDSDDWTPLMAASNIAHAEIVKLLLAVEGIDVNCGNICGATPLIAATYRGHVEVVKLLLAAEGIDVNTEDITGETTLMKAVRWGRTEIADLLRRAGAQ